MKWFCETSFIATSLALNWNPMAFDVGLANLSANNSAGQRSGLALKACHVSVGGFLIKTLDGWPLFTTTVTNWPNCKFSSSVAAAKNWFTVRSRSTLEVFLTDVIVEAGPFDFKIAAMIYLTSTDVRGGLFPKDCPGGFRDCDFCRQKNTKKSVVFIATRLLYYSISLCCYCYRQDCWEVCLSVKSVSILCCMK